MIATRRYLRFRYLLATGLLISFFSLSGYIQTVSSKLPVDQTEQVDKRVHQDDRFVSLQSWSSCEVPFNRSTLSEVFQEYCHMVIETTEKVRFFSASSTQSRDRGTVFFQRKTIPSGSDEPAPTSLIG